MEAIVRDNTLVVKRGEDKKIYKESTFWAYLRNELRKQGCDVIAKLMHKDGHMVADTQHYVRTRNMNKQGAFMVWQTDYAIREPFEAYNKGEYVTLTIERDFAAYTIK